MKKGEKELDRLAKLIVQKLRDEFAIKHLSKNLVNTIKVENMGDEIKIYQDVEEISYKEGANGTIEETDATRQVDDKYKFVYTFKLADDGMYNFVSRTKEK